VQHFAHLSGQVPIPSSHLDALLPSLIATTSEVPFYAAMVARTRLLRLNDRLSASVSGSAPPPIAPTPASSLNASKKKKVEQEVAALVTSPQESSWPPPRALLQLKLFLTLYPSSDKRHPVITPVALFIGRALSQCVASDVGEVIRGLFLSSLALGIASSANRHYPEALSFLVDALLSFAGKDKVKEDRPRRCVALGILAPVTRGKALAKLIPAKVRGPWDSSQLLTPGV
jgi:nucleolar protein 14